MMQALDRPIRIGNMSDGLNLVVGPNEMGKSTLFAALHAVLFERHRSQAQAVWTMNSRSSCCGCQSRTRRILALPATRTAGSPGRRGPASIGKSIPVTRRTVSSTARTLAPWP